MSPFKRQRRIKIVMHAFCDEGDFNAQNLNAREIASRLNQDFFEVTLFYRKQPDLRLFKENINLVRVPPSGNKLAKVMASLLILRHLLGNYDIFFSVRTFNVDRLYIMLRKILYDKKIMVHTIENPAPCIASKQYTKISRDKALNPSFGYSVSRYVAETMAKVHGIRTPVLYVGVDTDVFKPKAVKEKGKKIRILYVGSFQRRKRPQLVIEAAKRFPNVEFHLIGGGPLESYLFREKKKAKVSNVFFHGHVPLKQFIALMQEADIFLFPSVLEGFPKVTLEAASTGLPSIVFEDYKPETVVNGETGYIVADVDEMIEKLKILVEDRNLRQKMGANAREHAKRFDWNIIVRRWEEVFLDLITHVSVL